MSEFLPLSVGIGLAVSLLFTELFGLAAGGMIVPGYFALFLTRPLEVLLTLAAGFITFAIVHALSSIVIVYGRRRTVLMILLGYLVGTLIRWATRDITPDVPDDYAVIGFIIPGLIAIWLDRQGVFQTVCSLVTASVVVRLLLVVFIGTELH
jgi:poly-gamma-glutamate biosynthesis protein PgsC/CapC